MSVALKVFAAIAVVLAVVVGNAAPAAAQTPRGIYAEVSLSSAWTLTVINLTNYPLVLTNTSVDASGNQRPPFWGNTGGTDTVFPLPPYRNATWKSNTSAFFYPDPHWSGKLTVLPQETEPPWTGSDPKWTVTLNFLPYPSPTPYATWVYLTADINGNPDWQDASPYNISCSYPGWGDVGYNTVYNVMTLSGTDLVATFYTPYIAEGTSPSVDAVLVIRQRWPHTELTNGYDDSLTMPCTRYLDNGEGWD